MPRPAPVPPALEASPFRATTAIAAGHITPAVLRGAGWRRLLPDVYIHETAYRPDDHHMWCRAVALTLPATACLGGWSAALLRGLDLLPADAKVWINVPLSTRLRARDHVLVKRTPLPPYDLVNEHDTPLATPMRTAFDLGRHLPRADALAALDAHCRELVDPVRLAQYVADLWEWPGTRQLRELLPLIEPLAESPAESRVRLHLHDAGAPRPVAQYVVRSDAGTFLGRVDLAYPDQQIAIEYEGDHHRGTDQFRHDVERHNKMQEAGWIVLRVTADDLFRHPHRLTRRVMHALATRRAAEAPVQ